MRMAQVCYRMVLGSPPRTWLCTHMGISTGFFPFSLLGQSLCHHATVPCGEPSPETGAAVGRYGLVPGDSAFLVCEEHLRCPHQAKAISACLVAGAALCQTLLTVQISGRDGAVRVLVLGQPISFPFQPPWAFPFQTLLMALATQKGSGKGDFQFYLKTVNHCLPRLK